MHTALTCYRGMSRAALKGLGFGGCGQDLPAKAQHHKWREASQEMQVGEIMDADHATILAHKLPPEAIKAHTHLARGPLAEREETLVCMD